MNSENIWNQFSEKLKNFLLKRVNDPEIANDLLQEVFLKIHLKLPLLKEEKKVENWVFQIAYNQLNDFYRAKSKNKTDHLEIDIAEPVTASDHELGDCLVPFIESLPEVYKQAVIMSEIEGMKQKEVAEKLGISVSGAKSKIQRGRAMIKQHFVECCHFHIGKNGKLSGEHNHNHESWNCDDDECLVH
jgi:RNA polymerase sigma-70 factor, ECF subfamily